MREIVFRGKSIITGEWVFGQLYQMGVQAFIMANNRITEVDPETVGQYTGFKDDSDRKVFEGDIIKNRYEDEFVVKWDESCGRFYAYGELYRTNLFKGCEIIGNNYDKI